MSDYECPKELRPLEKIINDFAYSKGLDLMHVFNDFLDYTISFFTISDEKIKWRYNESDTAVFFSMLQEYIIVMQKEVEVRGWYDALGGLFIAFAGKGSKSYRGQFFTPEEICDTMTLSLGDIDEDLGCRTTFGKRISVNDCACGSGRTLLSYHSYRIKNNKRKPYLCAEDIDLTCVKMTAINFCIHGCFGEVICHDSICNPDTFSDGYRINEGLYPLPCGIPTIRKITPEESYTIAVWKNHALLKKQHEKECTTDTFSNLRQLTLF